MVYVCRISEPKRLQLPEDPLDFHEINKDKEAAIESRISTPPEITLRFLDKAAIQASTILREVSRSSKSNGNCCRVTQVENAKNFYLHIPVPIYDRLAVPFARKFTGLPTGIIHLQRIGVGLILSSICMASAALMEVKRRDVARDHNMLDAIPVLQPLPISTLWVSIHFFIFDIADMFTYVGLLEFFYSEAPKGLKSISTCFLWSSMALGYFLSTILVNIVNGVTKGSTKSGGWPQNASLPSNENREAPANQEDRREN
ncbi:hypothetical protein D5086_008266 [Populus alba]|uniref:Uncharacterized protein n=1 Tax=Populus alba TaxID=43335 RepID=A0ACC4CF98_POPAL